MEWPGFALLILQKNFQGVYLDIFSIKEVSMKKKRKFFLEDLFKRDVDLVLTDSLKEQIKPKISREVHYVQGI